jgi:predicted nucleotidyltransferase
MCRSGEDSGFLFPSYGARDSLVHKGKRSVATQEQRNLMSVAQGRWLERDLLAREPLLAEIVRRLVKAIEPERIYLFGSMARGDAGPDSDYDILVLVEHPTEPLYRLSLRGFRALRGIDAAVDVVVWDRATFDARLHLPASFPATVVREGRLLHAA